LLHREFRFEAGAISTNGRQGQRLLPFAESDGTVQRLHAAGDVYAVLYIDQMSSFAAR